MTLGRRRDRAKREQWGRHRRRLAAAHRAAAHFAHITSGALLVSASTGRAPAQRSGPGREATHGNTRASASSPLPPHTDPAATILLSLCSRRSAPVPSIGRTEGVDAHDRPRRRKPCRHASPRGQGPTQGLARVEARYCMGARHELLNGAIRDVVLRNVAEWLGKNCEGRAFIIAAGRQSRSTRFGGFQSHRTRGPVQAGTLGRAPDFPRRA